MPTHKAAPLHHPVAPDFTEGRFSLTIAYEYNNHYCA